MAEAAAASPSRSRRAGDTGARRTPPGPAGGPSFINDEAEEQHYLDLIRNPRTEPVARGAARLDLARLYERAGQFADAAEMYEQNIWDGIRSPATYAGLAAAYRELGRDDLAESTLEQVRRQGGAQQAAAARHDEPPTATGRAGAGPQATRQPRGDRSAPSTAARAAERPVSARADRGPAPSRAERTASLRSRLGAAPRSAAPARRPSGFAAPRAAGRPAQATGPRMSGSLDIAASPRTAAALAQLAQFAGSARAAGAGASQAAGRALGQLRRTAAPLLEGQAGRRTLMISTVGLPIVLGLVIFGVIVVMSARGRSEAAVAAAPTPAPVATIAPTVAPTSAIPAVLAGPSNPTRMLVKDVGTDGLSLRRSPGVGQRIKVWGEGTVLSDLGETAEQAGKTWRRVRDPEGNEGWAAADFLAEAGPATGGEASAGARGAPAAPPFASGGLGLSRTEWEKAHGQPTRTSIFLEYVGGRLVVGLLENNVWHIERVWKRDEALDLDAARNEARAFLPSDAALMQSVDRGDGRVIDVYSSAILTNRFGATAWNGGRTGTFSIQYRFRSAADRLVTSAMFRLGDSLF